MKKVSKIVGWVLAGLGVLAASGFGYVQATWDRDYSAVAPPPIHASTDSAVIARGEYLVRTVAHCSGCHAAASDPAAGILGPLTGGFEIDAGPFGQFVAANLTADSATGLGGVSDGLIARTLRSGITRMGRAAPIMLSGVGPMADQDLTARAESASSEGGTLPSAPPPAGPVTPRPTICFGPTGPISRAARFQSRTRAPPITSSSLRT